MILYEFKCTKCGQTYTSTNRNLRIAQDDPDRRVCIERNGRGSSIICFGNLKRVFGFNLKRSMPEHFNNSVGKYVSNESKLRDEFKRLSETATARTGIPHNYVPVDPMDKETLGVTDEGLDATHDDMVRRGEKDETSKRKVIHLG